MSAHPPRGFLSAAPVPLPRWPGPRLACDGGQAVGDSHRENGDTIPCLCSQILESSQTLLSVLKREAGNLTKATASEQKSSGGKDS